MLLSSQKYRREAVIYFNLGLDIYLGNMAKAEEAIRRLIRDVPDYPKPGIIFKDITPLLKDSGAFRLCVDELASRISGTDFDYIVGIEARGFVLGGALAYKMGKGFIPVRKKGKLPYTTVSKEYQLEYGSATIEMHKDSFEKGDRIMIVDDLLATGGTALATATLIEDMGGIVSGFAFIIELSFLDGRKALGRRGVTALVKY